MTLYLTNEDVAELLPIADCIETMDKLFRDEAAGLAESFPRQTLNLPRGWHRTMSGGAYGHGAYGLKTYGAVEGRPRYRVLLFSLADGALEAILDAKNLSQIRTAAVSGVATRYMAREDAATIGIIGTGFEARGQIEAIAAVRPIRRVLAYSRSAENRDSFAAIMSDRLGIDVAAADSAEVAVRDADIVVTVTKSADPVLRAEWLKPGAHLNAVGATALTRREIDIDTVRASTLVAVENLEQARLECGELIWAHEHKALAWNRVAELSRIVSGAVPGRPSPEALTQFNSLGIAAEDIAAAAEVVARAKAAGRGVVLPI
jgi:ornithine cyclodeaminase/alanine dehydrogenase-like protein (mu-crystallin family)